MIFAAVNWECLHCEMNKDVLILSSLMYKHSIPGRPQWFIIFCLCLSSESSAITPDFCKSPSPPSQISRLVFLFQPPGRSISSFLANVVAVPPLYSSEYPHLASVALPSNLSAMLSLWWAHCWSVHPFTPKENLLTLAARYAVVWPLLPSQKHSTMGFVDLNPLLVIFSIDQTSASLLLLAFSSLRFV